MIKLPKLIHVTKEKRRVYPIELTVNNCLLTEIHIDPHYEEKHSGYMNDEIIYNFVLELNYGQFIPEKTSGNWSYYSTILFQNWKAYEMIWCLKDKENFLGVRTCYRRHKYDK